MMCCNICPFHPLSGYTEKRCELPICPQQEGACMPGPCARLMPHRCLQDEYVISNLTQNDRMAQRLATETFETALLSRNQTLLLDLFRAAPTKMVLHFWQRFKEEFSHLIYLLNPVFTTWGLLPLSPMPLLPANELKYLRAIIAGPRLSKSIAV